MTTSFDPLRIGDLSFENRIWMSALTRSRASAAAVPMADYYSQRATAGLIISEGTYINRDTCGLDRAPSIFTSDQVEAWKPITEAVHEEGGLIFCQLLHCGRVGAAGLLGGREPLSPNGINDDLGSIDVYGLLANGAYAKVVPTPSRAMTLDEIRRTIADYGRAAANAKAAGFDGVEIHSANGCLPHQFLSPALNRREDAYGGGVESRARFLLDVFETIAAELPRSRIGVSVSPYALCNNARDPDPNSTYSHLAQRLDLAGAGYLHFTDTNGRHGNPDIDRILAALRPNFSGPIVANGGIAVEQGADLLATGIVQAVFRAGIPCQP
jgi:2,4-dienoyl-CoA reductase-like NADH-dependent reductase (Old Yellow Enzyme family)